MDHDRPPTPSGNGNGRQDGNTYRAARIGTAAALTGVLVFLLALDAFSAEYNLSEVTLTALLATILTLLGIEAGAILGKRR